MNFISLSPSQPTLTYVVLPSGKPFKTHTHIVYTHSVRERARAPYTSARLSPLGRRDNPLSESSLAPSAKVASPKPREVDAGHDLSHARVCASYIRMCVRLLAAVRDVKPRKLKSDSNSSNGTNHVDGAGEIRVGVF